MEYPEIPISLDTWSDIIKKGISGQLDTTAKYIDIQDRKKTTLNKGKRGQKTLKTKSNNKKNETKPSPKKKKKTVKKKKKSIEKQRVLKAPVNFI